MDNRDVGLSGKFGEPHDIGQAYTLGDMAGDVCSVLDALGLVSAHIVGQSMGGAVAQMVAIDHPARVRSLVLVYTVPSFSPEYLTDDVMQRVAENAAIPPATNRAEAVEAHVANERYAASSAFGFDEDWIREVGGRMYDRGYRPDGIMRQTAMALASGDRSAQLAKLTVPTAIIHGRDDRLLKYQASIKLAELIKSAELHLYPGMGHQVVPELWDEFATIIARTAAR
jgi:pimeloyl-ACP methyl ester carboxylesterase